MALILERADCVRLRNSVIVFTPPALRDTEWDERNGNQTDGIDNDQNEREKQSRTCEPQWKSVEQQQLLTSYPTHKAYANLNLRYVQQEQLLNKENDGTDEQKAWKDWDNMIGLSEAFVRESWKKVPPAVDIVAWRWVE